MSDANERYTPNVPKMHFSKGNCPQVPDKKEVKMYQQLQAGGELQTSPLSTSATLMLVMFLTTATTRVSAATICT